MAAQGRSSGMCYVVWQVITGVFEKQLRGVTSQKLSLN